MGLYEVESINNPNIITLALNPKEYFEVFRSKEINKKHKGVKKNTAGMTYESFASIIMDIREYTYIDKNPKKIKQKRFQVKRTNMQMTTVSRNQFGLLNSKRYYLADGVTSLPYGHFLLTSRREEKNKYEQIHTKIMHIKHDLLRQEFRACSKCERIRILRSILAQPPTYFKLTSTKRAPITNVFNSTREFVLGGMWQ